MGENMRDRVAARAAAAGAAPGTDVATTAARPPATILDHIRSMQDQFQLAMPKGAEAAQLVRDAITALRTTKNLEKCDAPSVIGSLMTCAQLGLRPGVLGQAWILPYWDSRANDGRGGHRAQLIVGYKGMVALAYRSPNVSTVIGRMARAGEIFEVDYGVADSLVHKPNLEPGVVPGDVIAYYVVVKLTDGGHVFYVMTRAEAEAYKERYAPTNRDGKIVGPWVDNFDEMALKSCLRQLAKWMPQSTELQQAIDVDGTIRVDTSGATLEASSSVRPDGPGVIDIDPGDITEHAGEPGGAQA